VKEGGYRDRMVGALGTGVGLVHGKSSLRQHEVV
jgi:hypothetical protein